MYNCLLLSTDVIAAHYAEPISSVLTKRSYRQCCGPGVKRQLPLHKLSQFNEPISHVSGPCFTIWHKNNHITISFNLRSYATVQRFESARNERKIEIFL